MFHLVDRTTHTTTNDNSNSTSYLDLAIESCDKEYNINGEYPTIYKELATTRRTRWREAEANIIQMINEKLGGLYYATKLGVRTPRILFCGVAGDLPKDINTLGGKYVVKPLRGHSSQGVKVIVDGVNTLTNQDDDYYDEEEEEFSYNTLVDE